jgi:hypothetical protein
MSQTSIIFGSLAIAYFVFITIRGELPAYQSVLTGSGNTPSQPQAAVAPSSSVASGNTGTGSLITTQQQQLLNALNGE